MINKKMITQNDPIMFLAWESPWPAYAGGRLRTLGLLKELSKAFSVQLVILSTQPLSEEQKHVLTQYASSIACVQRKGRTLFEQLPILALMIRKVIPYHCAQVRWSFKAREDVLGQLRHFSGVVFASYGHAATLLEHQSAPNWIINQYDADVDFWRAYASQASNVGIKLLAWLNWRLAKRHFPQVYPHIGRIISVCEEDRQLTQALSPTSHVDVIENGIDCAFFQPDRPQRTDCQRLLFTGTSAARNITALRQFIQHVFPALLSSIPEMEILVAGNFSQQAQEEFKKIPHLRFTGKVEDIRPYFNESDIYIAPFQDAHGSKLKIIEAMAMGMPIVSTPQGIRGFPLINGESVLIANTAQEFSAHIQALWHDRLRREQLGMNARKIALSLDWSVLGKRLSDIIHSVQA
jgi:polysaccharide biosynthesis protein PslH